MGELGSWRHTIRQLSPQTGRIALLSGLAATDPETQARVAALQQELKELGWTEGRNCSIEFRWGTGERDQMRTFAMDLIDLKPDVIIGMTTAAVAALVQETKTIPILFVNMTRSRMPQKASPARTAGAAY